MVSLHWAITMSKYHCKNEKLFNTQNTFPTFTLLEAILVLLSHRTVYSHYNYPLKFKGVRSIRTASLSTQPCFVFVQFNCVSGRLGPFVRSHFKLI